MFWMYKLMKAIRILIVEDDTDLLPKLKALYRELFMGQGFDSVTIEETRSADEAKRLAKDAAKNPYDFVSLDVNLGNTDVTGLDVLEAFNRFQSAWMVTLLTGVETDSTLDATVGSLEANILRKQLRPDAYAKFPSERLLVVEKPSVRIPAQEAEMLLRNRIQQITLVYEAVSRLRYIFRPIEATSLERVPAPKGATVIKQKRKFIETTSLHWQIRFNCGDIRTLPDKAGFKTLHHLLSLELTESLTPEAAMVIEPRNEKGSSTDSTTPTDNPIAEYFNAQGVEWENLTRQRQDEIIRVALSLRFKRYVELRGFEDESDLSLEEETDLARIKREFGPLADMAETAYQRLNPEKDGADSQGETSIGALAQDGLHAPSGSYERREGGRGVDSPDAQRFRARKKRICDCLRENGFADFATHVEHYVMPSGANWSYIRPSQIEWTTN